MRPVAMISSLSVMGLAACGGSVRIAELKEDDRGYTHSASTEVGVLAWSDSSAGEKRVAGRAKEFCGLPKSTSDEDIRLTRGLSIYGLRNFVFSCPEQGKDTL